MGYDELQEVKELKILEPVDSNSMRACRSIRVSWLWGRLLGL